MRKFEHDMSVDAISLRSRFMALGAYVTFVGLPLAGLGVAALSEAGVRSKERETQYASLDADKSTPNVIDLQPMP